MVMFHGEVFPVSKRTSPGHATSTSEPTDLKPVAEEPKVTTSSKRKMTRGNPRVRMGKYRTHMGIYIYICIYIYNIYVYIVYIIITIIMIIISSSIIIVIIIIITIIVIIIIIVIINNIYIILYNIIYNIIRKNHLTQWQCMKLHGWFFMVF